MAGKRSGNREGTIYRRADGRWEGKVTTPDGRRKSVYGRTRDSVRAAMAQAMRDAERGGSALDARLTLGQYLSRWLADVQPAVRPRTIESYSQHACDHIVPSIGRVKLAGLTPAHVRTLMADVAAKGLSASTVWRVRATLRCALGQAERDGLVIRNVAKLVDAPRVQPFELLAMTVEAARAVIAAFEGDKLGPLVVVALLTGLRRGELLGLQWCDVDLDGRTLAVNHALQRVHGRLSLAPPKSSSSRRTIPLAAAAVEAFKRQRAEQARDRLLAGSRWCDSGHVFTTTVGTPIDPSELSRRFGRRVRAAGLPPLRLHDLRHGTASMMIAMGVPVRAVADQLGHSSVALTLSVYAHMPDALLVDAADRLGAALGAQAT